MPRTPPPPNPSFHHFPLGSDKEELALVPPFLHAFQGYTSASFSPPVSVWRSASLHPSLFVPPQIFLSPFLFSISIYLSLSLTWKADIQMRIISLFLIPVPGLTRYTVGNIARAFNPSSFLHLFHEVSVYISYMCLYDLFICLYIGENEYVL